MSRSNYRFYIPWMTAVLRLTAARHGRKDGRVGIPRPARAGGDGRAARASHFEMRIKQKIDKDTRGLATAWSETDAELLASYCEAVERRRRSDARLAELGGRLATLRASAEALAKEWRSQLDEIRIPSWLHWTLVIGLGIGEIPLNAVAFRVLGESNLQTLLFSSTLAIGLPLLAEGAGVFLRRTGLNKSRPLAERALLIVLLLVALGLIGGISWVRARYLEGAQVLDGLGIEASASGFLWTFALVNLVLFVAAMLAAYLAYVPRVRDLAQRRRLVRREIHVAERALEREEKLAEQLAVQMARSRVEREKLLDAFQLKIRSWEDMYQEAWEIYRDANVRARLKAGLEDVNPDSFGEYPQIKAEARPPVSLDWGCDNEKTADTGSVEQGVTRVVSGNPS